MYQATIVVILMPTNHRGRPYVASLCQKPSGFQKLVASRGSARARNSKRTQRSAARWLPWQWCQKEPKDNNTHTQRDSFLEYFVQKQSTLAAGEETASFGRLELLNEGQPGVEGELVETQRTAPCFVSNLFSECTSSDYNIIS